MFRVWVATQERERRCREAGVEMYLPAPDLRPPCVPFSLVGASAAADAVCLRVDMVTRRDPDSYPPYCLVALRQAGDTHSWEVHAVDRAKV